MEKKTLYRYFGNCATEEERIQVLEWTKASPENLKEFCRERNIYNAILLSTDNIQRTKYDFRRHYRAQLLRIAAVVILLLSVAFGSFYLTMGDRIVPLYSLTVPAGNSNTLLLPDGTKVWLNAGSTIKYPSSFLGMQRNIEIEGEAYLEVAHNRWKPFIVNTPNGKVKVLGTKFYVTSTLKEKDFMVSLIEGSVKISSGEKSAMLKPGYRAQFKDGEFKQSVIRTFETELWKDGIYYFKDKSFDELMEGFVKYNAPWGEEDLFELHRFNVNIDPHLASSAYVKQYSNLYVVDRSEILDIASVTVDGTPLENVSDPIPVAETGVNILLSNKRKQPPSKA